MSHQILLEQNKSVRRRIFLKGIGAIAATSAIGGVAAAESDESDDDDERANKRIVGYYPSYAGEYTPEDVPYEKITHLNYAFLEPQSNGEVELAVSGDYEADLLARFREVASKHEETSFMFSISSGWYSGVFSDAALTPERRQRFARTAIDIMQRYNFDGIDIDWEYPDGTIRESDPHHLTLLLKEIRQQLDELAETEDEEEAEDDEEDDEEEEAEDEEEDEEEDDQRYELSMAAGPLPSYIDPMEIGKMSEYLDHVNVMNYNYYGGWSAVTNFNSPLYQDPDAPTPNPTLTTNHAMMYWASQPIAREKVVLGMPFYGRTFKDVTNKNHGLYQDFDGGTNTRSYWDIQQNIKPKSHYDYYWNSAVKVPWLFSSEDDVFVTYDDEHAAIEKTEYVIDNEFGGVMAWELSQDPSNTLVSAIHTVVARSEAEEEDDEEREEEDD